MPFQLFPAIDIRGGRCVRLMRGDYDAETVYDEDPVAVARRFGEAGASWIHVVDLDAARTGEPANAGTVAEICSAVDVRVQVGGGIRSLDAARRLHEAGVARVVVGTAVVDRPDLVDDINEAVGVPVAVGLDVLGDEVRVRGWTEGSGRSPAELVADLDARAVDAFVVTRIEADGTMEGPDIHGLTGVLAATDTPVLASGGVGTLAHIRELSALAVRHPTLDGVIVGRALYEGRFTVEEALGACSQHV